MSSVLHNGDTLLFIGDSITDCGRRDPENAPLGRGYVRFFHDLLTFREPEKRVKILNRGIGGNTVDDLRSRWTDDVLTHRPDWLSIKIGINDVNQHLCSPDGRRLPPEEFRAIYEEILTQTRDALPDTRILLISPFFLSNDTAPHSYRAHVLRKLPDYIGIAEEMSRQFDTRFLNLQERFQSLLKHHHPDVYCPEPVHPYPIGHHFMAEQVYAALSA